MACTRASARVANVSTLTASTSGSHHRLRPRTPMHVHTHTHTLSQLSEGGELHAAREGERCVREQGYVQTSGSERMRPRGADGCAEAMRVRR